METLWNWWDAVPHRTVQAIDVSQYLAGYVEVLLCRVFATSTIETMQSWWCDGILALNIQMRSPKRPCWFKLHGSCIWADGESQFYGAPYECEIFFDSFKSPRFHKLIVRFGKAEWTGTILRIPLNLNWNYTKFTKTYPGELFWAVEMEYE